MADKSQSKKVALEEPTEGISAMTDPDIRLLVESGMITEAEYEAILSAHCERYRAALKRMGCR